jgi:hypothetical protein
MNMKKALLPPLLAAGAFLLAGCMSFMVVKTSTLNTLPIGHEVRPLPITADLRVVAQRTNGEASGLASNKDRLIEEALAKALSQDPPIADGPDVLVAMNVFTEQTGENMRVVVTGYPAYYRNFRTAQGAEDSVWLSVTGAPDQTAGAQVQKSKGILPFFK